MWRRQWRWTCVDHLKDDLIHFDDKTIFEEEQNFLSTWLNENFKWYIDVFLRSFAAICICKYIWKCSFRGISITPFWFPCFRFVWMGQFVFGFVLCQFCQIFVKYLWPGILPIVSKPTLPFEFTNKVPLWRLDRRRHPCRPIRFEETAASTNHVAPNLCGG